jgi:2-hydroxy-3-oxopropionate reductase
MTTSPPRKSLLAQGAVQCASGKEVAERAQIIITMVPDTPHVAAALFGPVVSPKACHPERSSWT